MVRSAARTDGLNLAHHMPVTVPHFDVDPTIGIVGGQEDRRILAATHPPEDGDILAAPVSSTRRARSVHDSPSLGEIEHMF